MSISIFLISSHVILSLQLRIKTFSKYAIEIYHHTIFHAQLFIQK